MTSTTTQAIVIGSGIAGLASAIRLRVMGYDVQVFEANSYPGGKLHTFELGEYRFDGGPSLFTMPEYVIELFRLAGKNPTDYFEFHRCNEACRYFWRDGIRLHAHSDSESFAQEVEQKLNVPKTRVLNYFKHIQNIYNHSGSIFLEEPLNEASTWLSSRTLKALLRISQFDLFRTMNEANERRLQEPHLVQLFNRFATYNGSNPYKAPGILNVIPWLEHGFGTFFPKGGMAEIPKSLHRLAEDIGVEFNFNQRVEQIVTKNSRTQGIKVNGEIHESDIVVCNMDVHFAYKHLLPEVKKPERILNQEPSSSALVYYWGINRSFDELGLHNIFFGDSYEREFHTMFTEGNIMDDPTIYVNISSKENRDDAPDSGENWFVMINAPYEQGQDWAEIEARIRTVVIERLSTELNVDLSEHIQEEKIWNPVGIQNDTLSHLGALYGNSSNNSMAAFLRHPNASSSIQGLYFAGGSVHPGGGIPLALLSGKITSELIQKNAAQ